VRSTSIRFSVNRAEHERIGAGASGGLSTMTTSYSERSLDIRSRMFCDSSRSAPAASAYPR